MNPQIKWTTNKLKKKRYSQISLNAGYCMPREMTTSVSIMPWKCIWREGVCVCVCVCVRARVCMRMCTDAHAHKLCMNTDVHLIPTC